MTTLADQRIKNLRRTLAATTARGAVVYCEHLDASDALWRPQPLGEWAARKKHLAALDRELGRLGRLHDRTLESLRRAECHAHAHS